MVKYTIISIVLYFLQFYISSVWGQYITKINKKLKARARAAFFWPLGPGDARKK